MQYRIHIENTGSNLYTELMDVQQLQLEFAQKMAVRVACAATVALFVVLAFPYHPTYWFGWFAPFSVIISLLMFPFQNRYHAILWERVITAFIVMGVGLILYAILKNTLFLFCIIAFLFCLLCMYRVANHHRYHYGLFLAMIFTGLLISFIFTNTALVQATWQFPFAVLIGIVIIIIIDHFISPNTASRHLQRIQQSVKQAFLLLTPQQAIDLNFFQYWKQHLLNSRAQITSSDFHQQKKQNYLSKIIAYKHNNVIKQLKNIQDKKAYRQLNACHQLAIKAISNPSKSTLLTRKLRSSEICCGIRHLKQPAVWIVIGELHLLAKDIEQLHQVNNDPNFHIDTHNKIAAIHTGFNRQAFLFGLRSVISVAISIYLVFALQLPGGIQAIIATIVTAGSPNAGASVQKVIMRAGGIIIGTLAGFFTLILLASTQSLILYLLIFTSFIYWASRWCLSSEKYSYTGIQAALLFLIMVSNTGSTVINVQLSTQRLIGVLVGGFIAFIVVLLIAPRRPETIINELYRHTLSHLQMGWQGLHASALDSKMLWQHFATVESLLDKTEQALHEQRFLLTTSHEQYQLLTDLQVINKLLKQLTRLLSEDHHTQQIGQAILQSYHFDFSLNSPQSTQAIAPLITGRVSAKVYYCCNQIQLRWHDCTSQLNDQRAS